MNAGEARVLAADAAAWPAGPQWADILSTAVYGTALGDRTPSAVLDAAVVSRVLDAHNARPLRIQAAVTPTPPPPAALELFRDGYRTLRPFLREWLVAAADHGYRLPAEDLPLLRTLVEEEPHPYSAF